MSAVYIYGGAGFHSFTAGLMESTDSLRIRTADDDAGGIDQVDVIFDHLVDCIDNL